MTNRDIGGFWPVLFAIVALGALAERSRNRLPNSIGYNALSKSGASAGDRGMTEGGRIDSPDRHRNFIAVVGERISRDNLSLVAAGVAFYALLSLFPAMAMLVSLYGMISDPGQIAAQINNLENILPPEAMKLLTGTLQSIVSAGTTKHSVALMTSLALSLWSANAATSSIITGLNIAYRQVDRRWLVMQYVVSLAFTLGAILFGILALAALAIVPALVSHITWDVRLQSLLAVSRWPIFAVLMLVATALLYRFGAYRTDPKWRWISWGSGAATARWLGACVLFSFYVAHFGSYDVTYGSLGAVVILLLWFWVGAIALLAGAEIDAELGLRDKADASPATLLRGDSLAK
jgi:membrane protein